MQLILPTKPYIGREIAASLVALVCMLQIGVSAAGESLLGLTVTELASRCRSAPDAGCVGIAAGVLNQLQTNANLYRFARLGDEARLALETAGAACGTITDAQALSAFLSWADLHPEFKGHHGASGIATAVSQSWPCDDRHRR